MRSVIRADNKSLRFHKMNPMNFLLCDRKLSEAYLNCIFFYLLRFQFSSNYHFFPCRLLSHFWQMVLNTQESELTSLSPPFLSAFYSHFSISESDKYSPAQRHGNRLLVIFSVYRDALTYERNGWSLSMNFSPSLGAAIFT
jgi:hypothetical protein